MTLPRTPALATDCVVFDPLGRVLLIRRGHEPCAGKHALPGWMRERYSTRVQLDVRYGSVADETEPFMNNLPFMSVGL